MRDPAEIYAVVMCSAFAIAFAGALAFSLLWSALVMLARSGNAQDNYENLGAASLRHKARPTRWE